jgi:hypothetical protein
MTFSVVNELSSCSGADDSRRSMSDAEEDDIPNDKDSLRSEVGDGDGESCEDEEEDS